MFKIKNYFSMDLTLIIFAFSFFLVVLFMLFKISGFDSDLSHGTAFKNLNVKKCSKCDNTLVLKYFIFGKYCVKSCEYCKTNFIRITRRTTRP